MKRFLSALLVMVLLAGMLALPGGAMAATQYATVVGGWLRLRAYASFSAGTINSYYTGTQVKIISVSGSWYNVEAPDGQRGYMYGDYLSLGGYTPTPTPGGNATVVSSNGYGVRMRQGPSTSYRILGKYAVGTRVEILDSGSYWCRVRIGSQTGYMMTQFLSRDGKPEPSGDGDATVWSSNGYGVRLRSGPGTGYSKIGVYSVGTRVKILKKGTTWDYIQIGSRIGYMMNQFLIYNNNYNVDGVTINNMNPVVGNTLAVKCVSPEYATVTYEWYVNGVLKGVNASYLVMPEDEGLTIKLKVVGTGAYTGSATSGETAAVAKTSVVTSVALNNEKPQVGNVIGIQTLVPSSATVRYVWYVGTEQKGDKSTYTVQPADEGKQIYLAVVGTGSFSGMATSAKTDAVVKGASPTILTASLPAASKGNAYTAVLQATGGGSAFSWSVVSGTLPKGLNLTASTGVISGTPAADAVSATVRFKVSNGISPDAEKDLILTINDVKATAPTFTPAAGTYTSAQSVTLAAQTGATIYYTLNGVDPDTSSLKYTAAIPVAASTTIKAISVVSGMSNSDVATAAYTINPSAIPVTGVTLNMNSINIAVNETFDLVPTIAPDNASNKNVTWQSANDAVATVDANGKVTGKGVGETMITVKTADGGFTATCNVEVVNLALKGVTLNKTTISLAPSTTETLVPVFDPVNASNQSVTWQSDTPAVATVGADGKVTGVTAGTAKITVTTVEGGFTATCDVTVVAAGRVNGVTLDRDYVSLSVNESYTLSANVSPADATDKSVTWTSNKPGVATVDSSGKVTGVAAGDAIITVTTIDGRYTATCPAYILVVPTGVTLNKTTLSLTAAGANDTLVATVSPDNATDKTVTWQSSDTNVATVSGGTVTAVGDGTATITATTTTGGKTAVCTVTVAISTSAPVAPVVPVAPVDPAVSAPDPGSAAPATIPVSSVTLDRGTASVAIHETYTFTATVSPDDASDKTVTWATDDASVVTVDSNGTITGVGQGTANITATAGGIPATCAVTVIDVKVETIALNAATISPLAVGATQKLVADTIAPSNAVNKTLVWSSSDSAIATVDANGNVTGVAPGSATITATAEDGGGASATCAVTVEAAQPAQPEQPAP